MAPVAGSVIHAPVGGYPTNAEADERSTTSQALYQHMVKVGVAVLGLALIGCRTLSRDPVYADSEGPYDPGAPAQLRPARRADSTMSRRRTSGLVMRVTSLGQPVARAHVLLYPNAGWRDLIRDDSTGADGVLTIPDLPPGTYSGVARRIGYRQTLFLVTLSAGYVDTLDLRLGWPAR